VSVATELDGIVTSKLREVTFARSMYALPLPPPFAIPTVVGEDGAPPVDVELPELELEPPGVAVDFGIEPPPRRSNVVVVR
jgi:hypothetical protein